MRIDAHHHFWNYSLEEYQWIGDGMDVLKQDFGPTELEKNLKAAGIDGAISVQARTNQLENTFLLDFAQQHDFIKAVVGYVDLTKASAQQELEEFAHAHQKAVGVREVLQGMPEDDYCLRDDFNQGIALLQNFDLIYDILIFHRHLTHAIKLVDNHPNQIFVLDHIAKPDIQSQTPDPTWAKNLTALGEREQVYCKLSGVVTEVDQSINWTAELLEPYFDVALEAFGADRLMFGSDWPVCLLQSEYQQWVDTVNSWTNRLSKDEQAAFWGGTAQRAYGSGQHW